MTPDQIKQDYQRYVHLGRIMLALAHKLGGGFDSIAPLEEAIKEDCPFYCLSVFGASKTGKTSFLEQILDDTWELAEDKQKTGCALWQHSVARWGKTRLDGIVERHAPTPAFEDLRILDSADSSDQDVKEQISTAINFGDVNFWFFSSKNLRYAPTWELLRSVDPFIYRNSVIVISLQSSEKSNKELMDEMKVIKKEELGVDLPVVFWSPKDNDEYLEKIGGACSDTSCSLDHRIFFRNLLTLTDNLCSEVRRVVADKDRNMRQDGSFLRQLDAEIDALRISETALVKTRLEAMGQVAGEFFPEIIKTIVRKMGAMPSVVKLFRYRNYPMLLDKWVLDVLSKYLLARLESFDNIYVEKCSKHWDSVRPRAVDQLMCDIGEFPKTEMNADLNHYRSGVRRAMEKPIREFQLRVILIREFKELEHCMRGNLIVSICFIILGSILGIAGFDAMGIGSWVIGLLIWLSGVWELSRLKKRFVKDSAYLQESFVNEFIQKGLADAILEGALCNVSNYRSKLSLIHGKIFILKSELEPIQKEMDQIHRELRVSLHKL